MEEGVGQMYHKPASCELTASALGASPARDVSLTGTPHFPHWNPTSMRSRMRTSVTYTRVFCTRLGIEPVAPRHEILFHRFAKKGTECITYAYVSLCNAEIKEFAVFRGSWQGLPVLVMCAQG